MKMMGVFWGCRVRSHTFFLCIVFCLRADNAFKRQYYIPFLKKKLLFCVEKIHFCANFCLFYLVVLQKSKLRGII